MWIHKETPWPRSLLVMGALCAIELTYYYLQADHNKNQAFIVNNIFAIILFAYLSLSALKLAIDQKLFGAYWVGLSYSIFTLVQAWHSWLLITGQAQANVIEQSLQFIIISLTGLLVLVVSNFGVMAIEVQLANRRTDKTLGLLEEKSHSLSQSLDFNKTVLLTSPIPMAVFDEHGSCLIANEAFALWLEIPMTNVVGQKICHLDWWQSTELWQHCLAALESQTPSVHEFTFHRTSKEEQHVECSILPFPLDDKFHLLIQFNDVTVRKTMESELRHFAFHDSLTQLPNRRLFMERLKQAMLHSKRYQTFMAILFIDLNKFKHLNDEHGHEVGDRLLVEIASRLRSAIRNTDAVSRFGGDEFVILLESLGQTQHQASAIAAEIVDKIQTAIRQNFVIGSLCYQPSGSIGITLFNGDDETPDEILKRADTAMYQAKKNPAHS
jgi:diguanylate cyclase (GGDEF)-like protein